MNKRSLLAASLLSLLLFQGTIASAEPSTMKVMTLNIAHARSDSGSQWLQTTETARQNLWQIASVLKREQPHVAAFQEIDQNSVWNGRFDHTAYLAEHADYPHFFTGLHVAGNRLSYGTALVAKLPLQDSSSVRFSRPFARLRKGFVVSSVSWPGREDVNVDLVSVHLDFLSKKRRQKEANTLVTALQQRDNPIVIMGDLNTSYEDAPLISALEKRLALTTWQPFEPAVTFPRSQKRLDWILVSEQLEIIRHEVLEESVSDHRAVVAELSLIESL